MRTLAFLAYYVQANFAIALTYRAAFLAQVVGMVINDGIWVAFWWLFFARFPSVEGYGFREIVIVWSVGATAFGLASGLAGGALNFAHKIARGDLDFYLVLPKPVILHLAVSRMDVSGWGDALFGIVAFFAVVQPSVSEAGAFLGLAVVTTTLVVAYMIAINALAFWTGRAESLAEQALFGLITFSTYPEKLFVGPGNILLYTLIPAGFVSYIPVALVRAWDWGWAGTLISATVMAVVSAVALFMVGLRRYQSGSGLAMRA